jgi:phospholipid N-methyltransferase
MMAQPLPLADWPEHLQFLGRFLRSPRTIGALAPSSKWLAREMVANLENLGNSVNPANRVNPVNPVTVVELGTGTGAFTGEIVKRLRPTDRFLGVDVEPVFVERLRRRWPHVECVCASAETLPALVGQRQLEPIDHIVSGLPFASLPAETTRAILDAVGKTLRSGGTFTTFQYVHSYALPPAIVFRREMSALMGSTPSVRFVARNLPPALALSWTNRRASTARSC